MPSYSPSRDDNPRLCSSSKNSPQLPSRYQINRLPPRGEGTDCTAVCGTHNVTHQEQRIHIVVRPNDGSCQGDPQQSSGSASIIGKLRAGLSTALRASTWPRAELHDLSLQSRERFVEPPLLSPIALGDRTGEGERQRIAVIGRGLAAPVHVVHALSRIVSHTGSG